MSSIRCWSRWPGHDILRGRALHTHVSVDDYAHVIVACLAHDIGYVRGLFKDDDADGFVIDSAGNKVTLPRGASDAGLMAHHVDRSKLYRDGAGRLLRSTSSASPMRSKAPGFRRWPASNMTRRRRSFGRRISSGSSAIPTTSGRPTRSTMSSRKSASIASSAMIHPPTSSIATRSSTGTAWRLISRPRSAIST